MISAKGIVFQYAKGRLATRPEVYFGRGNCAGDLNSEILEDIYTGIKTEIGVKAAKSFVNMVGELQEDASASTFLTALYRLEDNNWNFNAKIMPKNDAEVMAEAIQNSSQRGEDATVSSMFGIAAMNAHKEAEKDLGEYKIIGEGLNIVGGFLDNHRSELKKSLPSYVKSGAVYYFSK